MLDKARGPFSLPVEFPQACEFDIHEVLIMSGAPKGNGSMLKVSRRAFGLPLKWRGVANGFKHAFRSRCLHLARRGCVSPRPWEARGTLSAQRPGVQRPRDRH